MSTPRNRKGPFEPLQLVDGHRMLTNDEIYALSTKSDEVEVFVMSLGGISRQSLKGVLFRSVLYLKLPLFLVYQAESFCFIMFHHLQSSPTKISNIKLYLTNLAIFANLWSPYLSCMNFSQIRQSSC